MFHSCNRGKESPASFSPPFDVVLAADVVYKLEAVPHLISTMVGCDFFFRLLVPFSFSSDRLSGPQTLVLFSFFPRVPEATEEFWRILPEYFEIERVWKGLFDCFSWELKFSCQIDDSFVREMLAGKLGSRCGVFKLKLKPK